MNYTSVVTADNDGEVFLCKLKDGRTLQLQVHDNCEKSNKAIYVFYNYEDSNDQKEYLESDVEEILELVEFDRQDDYEDSFDNINFKAIEKYLIDTDVWQYSNTNELNEILEALNKPIIKGGGWNEEEDKMYLNTLEKDYGIVFYWCEYDDFSCYGDGFTHHVKIISGVKKV